MGATLHKKSNPVFDYIIYVFKKYPFTRKIVFSLDLSTMSNLLLSIPAVQDIKFNLKIFKSKQILSQKFFL